MSLFKSLNVQYTGAEFCTESCHGRNELKGLWNFQCNGGENNLSGCNPTLNNRCLQAAGILCRELLPIYTRILHAIMLGFHATNLLCTFWWTSCQHHELVWSLGLKVLQPTYQKLLLLLLHIGAGNTSRCIFQPPTIISTSEDHNIPTTGNNEANTVCSIVTTGLGDASRVGGSSAAIGAVLGGVSAVLLLILMGVVMGWVWTCQRNKHKSSQNRWEKGTTRTHFIVQCLLRLLIQ